MYGAIYKCTPHKISLHCLYWQCKQHKSDCQWKQKQQYIKNGCTKAVTQICVAVSTLNGLLLPSTPLRPKTTTRCSTTQLLIDASPHIVSYVISFDTFVCLIEQGRAASDTGDEQICQYFHHSSCMWLWRTSIPCNTMRLHPANINLIGGKKKRWLYCLVSASQSVWHEKKKCKTKKTCWQVLRVWRPWKTTTVVF